MTRILQICSSLDGGGRVQTVLKNYYSHMKTREFRFDFIVHGDKIGEMEPWFEGFGSRIFHVVPRSKNPLKNVHNIAAIIKNGHYDVVHCHQDYHGAIAMLLAKHYGVKTRIIHCHRSFPPEKAYQKVSRNIQTAIIKHSATKLLACGRQASEWLYGQDAITQNKVFILNNAIETDTFQFSQEKREKVRKQLRIENAVVIGHVGRFSYEKNHNFLIDIFYEYIKKCPNVILLLIGDGELKNEVEKEVNALGIAEKIRLLGIRDDVPDLLNAMDVFVLPSRYEGLGIVAIEAQANGLPIVCSGYVPKEVAVTNAVCFIDQSKYNDITAWCASIDAAIQKGRSDHCSAIKSAGYDICTEAKKLEEIYKE